MTALKKYQRLEAIGSWRGSPKDEPQEVVVSIGDSTLVIRSPNDQPITHWSLAAIERFGASQSPAVFHPDGDPTETLELAQEEGEMIMAIETLRKAVLKSRPRPVRLRWLGALLATAAFGAALLFWLPDAVKEHSLRVVPEITRKKIGKDLQSRIEYSTGMACQSQPAIPALKTLATRTGVAEVIVLRAGAENSIYLPGDKVLLPYSLIKTYDSPEVLAGYIFAARLGHVRQDSFEQLLEHVGFRATLTLLTTGFLPAASLDEYAQNLLHAPAAPVDPADSAALLQAFSRAEINSTPFARHHDMPAGMQQSTVYPPVLRQADWKRLKDVCND